MKKLFYPKQAAAAFVDYAKQLKTQYNPYLEHEDIRYAVAYKMYEQLSKSGESGQNILDYFESLHNGDVKDTTLIKGFPTDLKNELNNPPRAITGLGKEGERGKEGLIAEFALLDTVNKLRV